MAKIAPTSIKYIIYAKFEADGAIEKPDVIGAIFGQTEGLLGEDMEMRELQKIGKIGRIDVNLSSENGKTLGEIEIPSAMDKNETSLIGAALETIEKIGPSETKITIDKIEDVRGSKRDFILERAKQLLGQLSTTNGGEMSNLKDMGRELGSASRAASLKTYGTENLPCGDLSGNEVIVVEGRADVVNMLRQGISNVICMNGVKLPEAVKELSHEKEITLFVDGDRGGKLIIKNVTENARVAYIAIAPEGKEVEELTSKEILQSLRKRMTVGEYFSREDIDSRRGGRRGLRQRSNEDRFERRDSRESEEESRNEIKEESTESSEPKKSAEKLTAKEKEKIKIALEELVGTKGAILFDKDLAVIRKLPIGRIGYFTPQEKIYVFATNDTALPSIIRIAERMGASHLVAKNFTTTDTSLNLVSL